MPAVIASGAESQNVTVTSRAGDPTGAAVEFAFVAVGAGTAPSSWTAGTWGTWDATTESVVAVTPTVGSAGTVTLAAGNWVTYIRYTVGGETVIEKVAGPPLNVRAG
jgi:hypothetical protein